jgi:hypothetical protein
MIFGYAEGIRTFGSDGDSSTLKLTGRFEVKKYRDFRLREVDGQ